MSMRFVKDSHYLSMSFISKVKKDKDSFNFRRHSDRILLVLIVSVHCLEK